MGPPKEVGGELELDGPERAAGALTHSVESLPEPQPLRRTRRNDKGNSRAVKRNAFTPVRVTTYALQNPLKILLALYARKMLIHNYRWYTFERLAQLAPVQVLAGVLTPSRDTRHFKSVVRIKEEAVRRTDLGPQICKVCFSSRHPDWERVTIEGGIEE